MNIQQAIMQAREIETKTREVLEALADYVTEQPIGLSSLQIDEEEIRKAKIKIHTDYLPIGAYIRRMIYFAMNELEQDFLAWLDLTEFTMGHDNAGYFLDDLQGANLGDINQDRFDNAAQIFDRMGIYIDDYLNKPLCDCADELGIDTNDVHDLKDWLKYRDQMTESEWDFRMIDMVCNHAQEIDLNKVVTYINAR